MALDRQATRVHDPHMIFYGPALLGLIAFPLVYFGFNDAVEWVAIAYAVMLKG